MSDAQVFLVTGPTGAMGEAVVGKLAASGHRLMLAARNESRLKEIADSAAAPDQIATVVADTTKPLLARRAVSETIDRFGRIDGLIHLVGGFHVGPVMLSDLDAYTRMFQANLLSAVSATQAVLPQLADGGHLVYLSSVLAREPFPGFGAYAASKAALQAWVKSLAHEVKHRGVHANVVVMTMADTEEARAQRPHMDFEQATKPAAVADVVDFLVSPAAGGLFGVMVPVLGKFEFSTGLMAGPPGAPQLNRL
ncbi:SDR family oxidoreductase [Actinacidiphila oryziradicis]|uniref:SDR family oxidoreductase n=1 Tax=Actinacidiphila oryziradicis TaxID=2571141 RepID=A0A4U0SS68_9ACTN|nr:SDR family oxidoreductase [Actinacidiphila oryziradicis]TKA11201.1 SDR family oxidoreductase [Actinacidiphila oryziradicis]